MKLKEALEIGDECGLSHIGEALLNIEIHAGSLFSYDKIAIEIEELFNDFKDSGLGEDDKIKHALRVL
jgi:hypothetical protein